MNLTMGCPKCRTQMQHHYAVPPYPQHWICFPCRAVYVMENGHVIPCAHPDDHLQNPPWWAAKKKEPEPPPLRAHDQQAKAGPS